MEPINFQTKEEFQTGKVKIKELLKKLKKDSTCSNLDEIKKEFKKTVKDANPLMIAMAEGELVNEGFSMDDLTRACDIHLQLFKDSIENPNLKVADDHPLHKFQEEHKGILNWLDRLIQTIKQAKNKENYHQAKDHLELIQKIANKLMEAESHNVRQENTLFPVLEKHGIEQPPKIMWMEHTEMKEQKKKLLKFLNEKEKYDFKNFFDILHGMATHLMEKFGSHTMKEENILYVTALDVISDQEWKDIKEECDNLGYFQLELN